MTQENASILVMKAAGDIRRAAALDPERAIELTSVADYLESIVFEGELVYEPIEDEPEQRRRKRSDVTEIEKLVTPFKVRLKRCRRQNRRYQCAV
jgi:hypothetical protein